MDYLSQEIRLPKKNIDGFVQKKENLLGKGASGEVYQYDTQSGEKLIIKMLWDGEWDSYEGFYEDFIWQSRVYEKINKLERSVKVHGYNNYTDQEGYTYLCFIMDYHEGYQDSFNYLMDREKNWSREGNTIYKRKDKDKNEITFTLDRSKKLSIIKNIILSLKEIHDIDIIHGDIKTNNIIIHPDTCDAKIIDFGATMFIERGRIYMETEWEHGTLGYRCPEEEMNHLLGKVSDIYSLAVTIIEIWVGDIWYSGETFKTCRNEVLRALRILEKEEKDLGTFLRKCLSMDGKRRPTIQTILDFFEDYS
jgi:serine/threonine protein kinase